MTDETALDVLHEVLPATRGKGFSSPGVGVQDGCGATEAYSFGDFGITVGYNACTEPTSIQTLRASLPTAPAMQRTSKDFHASYGESDAERFVVRPDLTLMVEYGTDHEACRMRLERRHEFDRSSPNDPMVPIEELTPVVDEVVPPEMRGQELGPGKRIWGSCYQAALATEYENVTLNPYYGLCERPPAVRGMEIYFKRPACESLPPYSSKP
jgi:hypothetical protein